MKTIHFDYETYSESPLKDVGAWAYSKHPSTEVLCMAYTVGDEHPTLWLPGDKLPEFVKRPNQFQLHAWNSFFEYCIWHNTLKWPAADISQWHDTAALAVAMALPRALGNCGAALGLTQDKQKDQTGKKLIQKLCKPYRGVRVHDTELLDQLYEYCKQDVIAEREIAKHLRPLSPTEREVWELDQKINIRGLHVDTKAAEDALVIYEDVKEKQLTRLKELTGLDNPNSRDQFHRWLTEQGYEVPDVKKSTLTALLEKVA